MNYRVPSSRKPLVKYDQGTKWSLSFEFCEEAGPFAWPTEARVLSGLFKFLCQLNMNQDLYEITTIKIPEYSGSMHHNVNAELFSDEAISRIEKILENKKFAQFYADELFCIRICARPNSTERIWCLLSETSIYPIWWDPKHEVYKTELIKNEPGRKNCKSEFCNHDDILIVYSI